MNKGSNPNPYGSNGTESNSTHADRYCLQCGYPLNHGMGSSCPECGRIFDLDVPGTYGRSPRSGSRQRTLNILFTILFIVIATIFIAETTMLFLGWDPLVSFLLTVALVPFLIALVLMALIPSLDVRPLGRVLAILLPILMILSTWPVFPGITISTANWPFRLSFLLHRASLKELAAEVRASGTTPPSARVGVLDFIDVQFIEPDEPKTSNLGFQITGGAGGGVHLVQTGPNPTFVWWNTNWEMDLGDGWHLVYQD